MCGSFSYDWEWLRESRIERHLKMTQITAMQRTIPLIPRGELDSYAWAGGTTLPLDRLTSVLEAYRFLLCSHPRDRIYAVLSMIPQPRGPRALEVAYEKSAVQLAKDCICHFIHADNDFDYVTLSSLAKATTLSFEGLHITSSDITRHAERHELSTTQSRVREREASTVASSVTILIVHGGCGVLQHSHTQQPTYSHRYACTSIGIPERYLAVP